MYDDYKIHQFSMLGASSTKSAWFLCQFCTVFNQTFSSHIGERSLFIHSNIILKKNKNKINGLMHFKKIQNSLKLFLRWNIKFFIIFFFIFQQSNTRLYNKLFDNDWCYAYFCSLPYILQFDSDACYCIHTSRVSYKRIKMKLLTFHL